MKRLNSASSDKHIAKTINYLSKGYSINDVAKEELISDAKDWLGGNSDASPVDFVEYIDRELGNHFFDV